MPFIAVFRNAGSAGNDVRITATLRPRNAAPTVRTFSIPLSEVRAGARVVAQSEIEPDSVNNLPEGLEVVLVYEAPTNTPR